MPTCVLLAVLEGYHQKELDIDVESGKDQRQPDVSREDGGPDGSNGSTVLQDINRRAESGARDVQTRFLLGGYSAFHG